jgi:hypothetical protein
VRRSARVLAVIAAVLLLLVATASGTMSVDSVGSDTEDVGPRDVSDLILAMGTPTDVGTASVRVDQVHQSPRRQRVAGNSRHALDHPAQLLNKRDAVANGSTGPNVRLRTLCRPARAKRQVMLPITLLEQEFRAFLECGVWSRGFARFQC